MYLKSLEMMGFKSFPDKTKLSFDKDDQNRGVTVIVGPNGSGKSNISDAMRWVLGEISSKSLRGSKMEDVIFGGADSRRPMGFAEVSVTFDNREPENRLDCEFDEVTVTRRYYRAGESEYFINKRPCRLKDIYTLFLNTGVGRDGYSIIGQGRIAEIISRKSDERRAIFEDASGIAKFRLKKDDAERRLKNTDDNMEKVMLVFNELDAEIEPLEKEAGKAKRAIELLEQKKNADVSLWMYDTDRIRSEIQAASSELSRSALELQNAEDSLLSLKAQNDRLLEQTQSQQAANVELQTRIQQHTEDIHNKESSIRVLENDIAHIDSMLASEQGVMENMNRNLATEEESYKALEEKANTLQNDKKQLEDEHAEVGKKALAALEAANALDEEVEAELADLSAYEKEATDLQIRMQVLKNSQKGSSTDEGIEDEIHEYETTIASMKTQMESLGKRVADYEKSLHEAENAQTGIHEKKQRLEAELDEQKNETNEAIFQRDAVAHKIQSIQDMEKNFDGYSGAVKFVMQAYEENNITDRDGRVPGKILGPLSSQIKVQDRFVTAIETALGASLQHIVVENEEIAKAAMYALKHADKGRTTFLPMSSMTPQTATHEMEEAAGYQGYIAVADTLVSCDTKVRGIIGSLLGRTLIFDNIDHATAMARSQKYRVKVVTLDGQQINVGGSFTGGSAGSKNGLLSRSAELKHLENDLKEKTDKVNELKKELENIQSELDEAENDEINLSDRIDALDHLFSAENRKLEKLQDECQIQESLADKLREDFKTILEERAKAGQEIERLKGEHAELSEKIRRLTEIREKKNEESADLTDQVTTLSNRQTELHYAIQNKESEMANNQSQMDALKARLDSMKLDVRTHIEHMDELRVTRVDKENEIQSIRATNEGDSTVLNELREKQAQLNENNADYAKRINEMNARIMEKADQKDTLVRAHTLAEEKLARLQEEQDVLSGALWEEYQMTRADAIHAGFESATEENHVELEKIQKDCTNKLRWIGHVDLGAADKYIEKKKRYDEMKAQIDDLDKAKKELEAVIKELADGMEGSFVDSFNEINENFGKIFAELFGGGSAELSLTDPSNVLESGIEIKAAPPGKIIKNLVQLSGGEQAFIGVALFFAILKVNPTPFCILDEIEAALDEVNVERLADYIKRYTDGTQFIMITHRRGTMAAADRLYGVTMPTHGISKVFTLNIHDVQKNKEGEWNGLFG